MEGWTLASQPCPIASQLTARGRPWLAGDVMAALKDGSPGLDGNLLHRFFRIHPSCPSPGGRRRPGVSGSLGGTSLTFCPVDARVPSAVWTLMEYFILKVISIQFAAFFVLTGASFQWKLLAVLVLVPCACSG